MEHAHQKRFQGLGLLALASLVIMLIVSPRCMAQHYESYFMFHGAYPNEEGTPYADEFQGLAHDQDNWFISSNKHEGDGKVPQLWKIPVQYNLKDVILSSQYPGVLCAKISSSPLSALGYSHYGDISYHRSNGEGYILVPVEYEDRSYARPNVIALFKASDLSYVDRVAVPDFPADQDPTGRSFGWIAVDTSGYVYASGDGTGTIFKFSLNWTELPGKAMALTPIDTIVLLDEDGAALSLGRVQGSDFAPGGRLFYILSGSEDSDHQYPNDGINVFNTQTWRRIIKSQNGSGHFNYRYSPGFSAYDEPEGLDIWDLDDGRAPGISGQLHVGMLDNELNSDEITIYHYINTIYVDSSYTGTETGEPDKPFRHVADANSLAWDGVRLTFRAAVYPEALTFSREVQLLSQNGTARIGTLGRISLSMSASINIYSGGDLKLHGPGP